MNHENLRKYAEQHAAAVVRGDLASVEEDFTDELRPQVPTLAQALPHPVRSAEVLSVDTGSVPAVVHIRYAGDNGELTIRSEWTGEPRPVISAAAPA